MAREMLSLGNGIREWTGEHRDNEAGKEFESKVMEQFEFKGAKVSAIVLFWYNIP